MSSSALTEGEEEPLIWDTVSLMAEKKKKIVKRCHFHTLLVKASYKAIPEFLRMCMYTCPVRKSQSKS